MTGHEGLEGKRGYNSTLSLISALDGIVWSKARSGRFIPGERDPVRIVQEVGTRVENLAAIGIRASDRPAHSVSLYRTSYRGPPHHICRCQIIPFFDAVTSNVKNKSVTKQSSRK